MEWLEQLPRPPVEIDEGVEGSCLRDPVDDAEIHPSIVGLEVSFSVVVSQLSDSESERKMDFLAHLVSQYIIYFGTPERQEITK